MTSAVALRSVDRTRGSRASSSSLLSEVSVDMSPHTTPIFGFAAATESADHALERVKSRRNTETHRARILVPRRGTLSLTLRLQRELVAEPVKHNRHACAFSPRAHRTLTPELRCWHAPRTLGRAGVPSVVLAAAALWVRKGRARASDARRAPRRAVALSLTPCSERECELSDSERRRDFDVGDARRRTVRYRPGPTRFPEAPSFVLVVAWGAVVSRGV